MTSITPVLESNVREELKMHPKLSICFLLAVVTTTPVIVSATTFHLESRVLKKKKGKTKSDKAIKNQKNKPQQCNDQIEEQPSNLFVQTANVCRLQSIKEGNHNEILLTFEANMDSETLVFSDRPFRTTSNWLTYDFIYDFDEIFGDDLPNAAFTAVSENTEQFTGPVVAILSNGRMEVDRMTGDGTIRYHLSQSDDQEIEYGLGLFFSENAAQVSFTDCSLFIDSKVLSQREQTRALHQFKSQNQNLTYFHNTFHEWGMFLEDTSFIIAKHGLDPKYCTIERLKSLLQSALNERIAFNSLSPDDIDLSSINQGESAPNVPYSKRTIY